MQLTRRFTMVNQEPEFNARIGNGQAIASVYCRLNGTKEMLVIIPVKHAPDFIKARVSIGSLGSTFILSQFDDLVWSAPLGTESYLNRRIADALGKFINIFFLCRAFTNHKKALARRLRSLPARRPALAISGVTWHQLLPHDYLFEEAMMTY